MSISVNGCLHPFETPIALLDLLAELIGPEPPPGVAVAVNGEVVRRMNWKNIRLADGDHIEIVKATQGG